MQKVWKNRMGKQEAAGKSAAASNGGKQVYAIGTWGTIAQNIGDSVGDYKGNKDVTRMRESILNRAKLNK